MKKVIFLFTIISALTWQANSQEISKNAIGLRFGDSDGFGPEINYQRHLGDNNRLELGLAWHSKSDWNAVKLTGIYQWVWNIDGGFNWYAGPGAGIGFVSYDYDDVPPFRDNETDVFAFITGDIGIEYNFDIPLILSLDMRPQFNLGYRDDVSFDVGLSARYQF
ncbi:MULTISPECIES: hypothetical protein [Aequorivita]|uniref:Outer membrane protein beta-barrel domain-containing protein n=2 Tax=Aequorivita TaxID=153265 RepID=A0AB35YRZ1_9FLAO|nr:hypothetical protein [Aequorivita sp. Ant34-E75]WGF91978.1 hypothetical protein QCQ61_12275 [Aequorivita sp. Ant34-E75]